MPVLMDAILSAKLVLTFQACLAIYLLFRSCSRFGRGLEAWILFAVARIYCGLLFHWRSVGKSPFSAPGAAIVYANHSSPVDPILLWMNNHLGTDHRQPRIISFLTASQYCRIRGIAWICRAMRCIPVDREGQDMKPIRDALRVLKDGGLIGVFPEGHLNRSRDLLPGHPGIAWLALKSGAPVFPVYIRNAPRANNMVTPFCTPARVEVCYGEAIDTTPYRERRLTHQVLEEFADRMMQELAILGGVSVQPR